MRIVDTSAFIEWLIGSPVGKSMISGLPEREDWLVPTIIQLELAKWLSREVGEDKADQVIAFTETCIVAELDTAIALSADPVNHAKAKHIERRHLHIRELRARNIVDVRFVKSEHNTADMFTKALSSELFRRHGESLGLVGVETLMAYKTVNPKVDWKPRTGPKEALRKVAAAARSVQEWADDENVREMAKLLYKALCNKRAAGAAAAATGTYVATTTGMSEGPVTTAMNSTTSSAGA